MKRANLHDYFLYMFWNWKWASLHRDSKKWSIWQRVMAPTHCTGVSQFLLETSDIYALPNLIFVEYYNLNFLFMTIMTCVPPSLNIFGSLKNLISPKFRPRQGWLRQLLSFDRNVIPFSKLSIIAFDNFSHCFYDSKIVFDASKH